MKKVLSILLLFFYFSSSAQELALSRTIVDTLTSKYFWGRGYTKNGMNKSADYIADFFNKNGLQFLPNHSSYFQHFSYAANSFPDKIKVKLNGKKLVPGRDFIVMPESRSINGKFTLKQIDSVTWGNKDHLFFIRKSKKLIWSPSKKVEDYAGIILLDTTDAYHPQKIKVQIQSNFIDSFETKNIMAFVPGTEVSDSFLVLTAHYDHLGGMGDKTYFPGANDNASGTALMLNLAQYYAKYPNRYSMVFIAFAGEEAGLLGSEYFVNHPLIALENIKFLINVDLAGTGDEGITIVNATEFPQAFSLMNKINDEQDLLKKIHSRGKAKNSDHYFFTEEGVPAFFIYTIGGVTFYHDIYDRSATLPLNEQVDLMQLIKTFFKKI